MAKNIMKDVARLLGVELEEEFEVENYTMQYKFTKDGLMYGHGDSWMFSILLSDLILGKYKVIKFPWKPKDGEKYYYTYFSKISGLCVVESIWCDNLFDNLLLKEGLVYRTFEEAKANLRENFKEITGKEASEYD